MNKQCQNALLNVQVESPLLLREVDKNKQLFSSLQTAKINRDRADQSSIGVKEQDYKQADQLHADQTAQLVKMIRDEYEMKRISDWKLILGNLVGAEMRCAAKSLQELEAITKDLATINVEREVNSRYQKLFEENQF